MVLFFLLPCYTHDVSVSAVAVMFSLQFLAFVSLVFSVSVSCISRGTFTPFYWIISSIVDVHQSMSRPSEPELNFDFPFVVKPWCCTMSTSIFSTTLDWAAYLHHPPPASWIARTAATFRILALLLILPCIFLTALVS